MREHINWTDIYTTSELEEFAKQFWIEKKMGGVEPTLSDMYIAGFVFGCKAMNRKAEQKIEFDNSEHKE